MQLAQPLLFSASYWKSYSQADSVAMPFSWKRMKEFNVKRLHERKASNSLAELILPDFSPLDCALPSLLFFFLLRVLAAGADKMVDSSLSS